MLLKLLSLIIGASLWYFVVAEDQIDITITVPIEVHNLPSKLVIANQYKRDIEASIRGPRRIIKEVQQMNISRPIDLSTVEAGAIVIKNDSNAIPFPEGITVQRLKPTNITLLVDQLVQKKFFISSTIIGEPETGHELQSLTLNPDQITVTGPKSVLDQQDTLQTYAINLDGLNKSTKLQVQLNLNDQMLNLIGETVITVNLNLQESMLTKTVRGIPINVRNTTNTYTTKPSMVTVEAEIPENLIRDTPELAMLFRASVAPPEEGVEDDLVEITVNGIAVPGHRKITVTSVNPKKVHLIPITTK